MEEWCNFHPKEVYVGVCPLCLNERLLIVAAKQGLKPSSSAYPSLSLPNIFALGSLHRRRKPPPPPPPPPHHHHDFLDFPDSTSTSFEDESFISIKFGENGEVSWDKSTSNVSKVSSDHSNMPWPSQTSVSNMVNRGNFRNKNMVDPTTPRARPMRWRKGIGHLLQVIKVRRSNKANVGGGGEGRE